MKSDIITVRISGPAWHQTEFQIPSSALPLLRASIQAVTQSTIDGVYQDHIADTPLPIMIMVLEGLTTLRKIEEVSNEG